MPQYNKLKSFIPKQIATPVETDDAGLTHAYDCFVDSANLSDQEVLNKVRNRVGNDITHIAIWSFQGLRPIIRTPTVLGPLTAP